MRCLTTKVWHFVRSDEALTATEYAVMLALIVCLCMGPVQTLGCATNQSFSKTANSIAE